MIVVNGEDSAVTPGTTISELLVVLDAPARGVAVAIDSEVVPRGEWDDFAIEDDTRVEVLTAVQGG